MTDETDRSDLLGMTADIVSAYVSNNSVGANDLASLIASVHGALSGMGGPTTPEADAAPERLTPSQIRKSITDDYLISFEDGKRYKSMKRSLSIKGLTPAEYRTKWGLPNDYPMVAPAYAAARSAMAKSMGLGSGGRQPAKTSAAKIRKPRAKAS